MSGDQEVFLSILNIIVGAIAPIIAFYLGTKVYQTNKKDQVAQERFDVFFRPFLTMYCSGVYWDYSFSTYNDDLRDEILNHISKNVTYLNQNTESSFSSFLHYSFNDNLWQTTSKGKDINKAIKEDYNMAFFELTKHIFLEYQQLCKQLKYPDPFLPRLPTILIDSDTPAFG